MDVPEEVISWLRGVFDECDQQITRKLHNVPNTPEESLDLTWIEVLSQFSSPVAFANDWAAKIETHYLGGLRHFYRWEIADIGVLLFVRRAGRIDNRKVALLQSKRLYPENRQVRHPVRIDYEIGFGRLADPEDESTSIRLVREFVFTEECVYGALSAGSDQVKAIRDYEQENKLKVYYQLYNPWNIPYSRRVPITGYETPVGRPTIGTRIVPSNRVHKVLIGEKSSYSPTLRDFANLSPRYGWSLSNFIVDELLGCREGNPFDAEGDERIQSLFYRRSGPISAAIAISIEGPEGPEIE